MDQSVLASGSLIFSGQGGRATEMTNDACKSTMEYGLALLVWAMLRCKGVHFVDSSWNTCCFCLVMRVKQVGENQYICPWIVLVNVTVTCIFV